MLRSAYIRAKACDLMDATRAASRPRSQGEEPQTCRTLALEDGSKWRRVPRIFVTRVENVVVELPPLGKAVRRGDKKLDILNTVAQDHAAER